MAQVWLRWGEEVSFYWFCFGGIGVAEDRWYFVAWSAGWTMWAD